MKYALLIYENEAIYGADKAGPKIEEIVGKHMAFTQELGARRIGGAGLKSTAATTTVRTAGNRKTVHDGPFAEAREQLGGFYLIEAANYDEAVKLAMDHPHLEYGGTIEVVGKTDLDQAVHDH